MKRNLKYLFFAVCSSIAILINYSLVNNFDIRNFYNKDILFLSFFSVLFYYIYKRKDKVKITRFQEILSVIFSLSMILGEAYTSHGSMYIIYKDIYLIILSIIKLIGFIYLFRICFCFLTTKIKSIKIKDVKFKNKYIKWYMDKLMKYPFRTSLISILLIFSIYIIAYYPIVMSPDPSFQIKMFFNVPTKYIDYVIQRDPNIFMTAHHPILQTYIMGELLLIGRSILNDNFGLFLYTLFQTIIYSSVLAYSIKTLVDNKVCNKHVLIVLCIYLFVPMYAFYTVAAVKDTLYTAFMMLYVIFIYKVVKNNKEITLDKSIYLFIVTSLICLLRNNGLYVILLSIPFLILHSKKNIFRIGIPIVLTIIFITSFNKILVPSLGISDGSIREALSIPFQATARDLKYHEDEYDEDELQLIDKMLNLDTLTERYNAELADPVKNEYNKYTTKEELSSYITIWFKHLVKHPGTYLDATLNNTYGYIYPNTHKWYIYFKYEKRITEDNLVDYHYNKKTKDLRNILEGYGTGFPYIPVIGLISSIGFNTWYVLIISSYLKGRKKKYLIVLIPLYISILICFASPANTYFRYAMPYIFMLPSLSALLLNERSEQNEKK